jgi:hypothetical protein
MVAYFFATSIGRTLASMLVVLLIQQFLAATLGRGGGLADAMRQAVGIRAAVWVMATLLIGAYLRIAVIRYVKCLVQERT